MQEGRQIGLDTELGVVILLTLGGFTTFAGYLSFGTLILKRAAIGFALVFLCTEVTLDCK